MSKKQENDGNPFTVGQIPEFAMERPYGPKFGGISWIFEAFSLIFYVVFIIITRKLINYTKKLEIFPWIP